MRLFWSLLLCCSVTCFTYGQRNVMIGFLDIDKVLATHSGFTESSQDLETKIASWRNEIDIRQKKLDEQTKILEIERPLLTEEIAEEREDDIAFEQEKLNQYIEQRFGVEGDWIQQKLKLAQPAQDEILTAIREIASDRKLNYVFDSTADILVLHSEKKYDISELVLKSILKQEKIENLQLSFDDDRKKVLEEKIQKRRDSILKLKELKKIKRDSLLKTKRNNLKNK